MSARSPTLDIEKFSELEAYLRARGHVQDAERARFQRLGGGVSNRTVLIEFDSRPAWVIKQALDRLRVATEWRSDPRRIEREAAMLRWLGTALPAEHVTALVFEDPAEHLLAMTAVPTPHENWKTRLLAGRVDQEYADQFGRLLGTLHARSQEQAAALAPRFAERTFFEELRLEPYYGFAGARVPAASAFLCALADETRGHALSLVHGDYSPKNILLHAGSLVLLDHEVAHWGDPTFDLGFGLTHLLAKALHLPAQRGALLEAGHTFWNAYQSRAPQLAGAREFQERAARQTLGCLLARVDGRSPLEYLTPADQAQQRALALEGIHARPNTVGELIQFWGKRLPSP